MTSQFLRESFKLIALDHVAYLIFAEIAELDSAFQSGTHFLYIVLETAQRRKPAVINRLPFTEHAGPSHASYATVSHEAAGNDALAKVEHLLHFGVSDDGFPVFGLEQTSHPILPAVLVRRTLERSAGLFSLPPFRASSQGWPVSEWSIYRCVWPTRAPRSTSLPNARNPLQAVHRRHWVGR